ALAEEGGEDAVLHVEAGQVLVHSHLEMPAACGVQEVVKLPLVEIVGGAQRAETLAQQVRRRQGIADVEAEVAAELQAAALQPMKRPQVADQDRVRLEGRD